LKIRQTYARKVFAPLLDHLPPGEVASYWPNVEVKHQALYSYEEVLAPFQDDPLNRSTVLASTMTLLGYLTDGRVTTFQRTLTPEDEQAILAAYAKNPGSERPVAAPIATADSAPLGDAIDRAAEAAFAALEASERDEARRILLRLVRVGGAHDGGGRLAGQALLSDFESQQLALVTKLHDLKLAVVSSAESQSSSRQLVVTLAPALVTHWRTLIRWAQEDQEFLLWRQRLRGLRDVWIQDPLRDGSLLTGVGLTDAERWLRKRPDDLNSDETAYIQRSRTAADRTPLYLRLAPLMIGVLIVSSGAYAWHRSQKRDQASLILAALRTSTDPLARAFLVSELDPGFEIPESTSVVQSVANDRFPIARLDYPGVTNASFSPDGRQIIFVTGNSVHLSAVDGSKDRSRAFTSKVLRAEFNKTGDAIQVNASPELSLWSRGAFEDVHGKAVQSQSGRWSSFSPDGKSWATTTEEQSKVFDAQTGDVKDPGEPPGGLRVYFAANSPMLVIREDENRASKNNETPIAVIDPRTHPASRSHFYMPPELSQKKRQELSWSIDRDRTTYTGYHGLDIFLWPLSGNRKLWEEQPLHLLVPWGGSPDPTADSPSAVNKSFEDFDIDARYVLVAANRDIWLFDRESDQSTQESRDRGLMKHPVAKTGYWSPGTHSIKKVFLDPGDGGGRVRRAVIALDDGTVKIGAVDDDSVLTDAFVVGASAPDVLSFSPDGHRLLTVADDGIRVWSLDAKTSVHGWAESIQRVRSKTETTACPTSDEFARLMGQSSSNADARARECRREKFTDGR